MIGVVTGAVGGMGAECARRFAAQGPVLLCDLSVDRLEAARIALPPGDHATLAGDITDPAWAAQVADMVRAAGGLSFLAHTAGLSPTMADARRILDVNLLGSLRLLDALEPLVSTGSVAVLIASIAGHSAPADRDADLDTPLADGALDRLADGLDPYAGYAYSKRGVMRLAESRAPAWGRRGARIATVSPGLIDTSMLAAELDANPVIARMRAATPLPRFGGGTDIADAVDYLCSPRASFITGTDLRVDGGVVAAMRFDPAFAAT